MLGLVLTPASVRAQDATTLRRELDQLRQQFGVMKEQYQKAIDSLTERLRQLEARPPTPAPGPGPGVAPTPPAAVPSLVELARPREPFALYERRGAGQLLFDIGIAGDFAGSFTPTQVEKAHVGSLAGEENRFFPREVELSLFGQVDPYARAEVRFEVGEEFEDGQRSSNVSLAEAHLTLLTLPFGTQLKLGQMRTRLGLLNESHAHDRPFIDTPSVLVRFFGDEGLVEKGAELVWVAPLPVYLQAIVGFFDGDNEVAFGRGSLRDPLVMGRLRTFLELGDTSALQLGVSGATGTTEARQRASYGGVDAKYKYIPTGWLHPLLTVGGELLYVHRRIASEPSEPVETEPAALRTRGLLQAPSEGGAGFRSRDAYGYYAWAELQPWRRWVFGTRYDWTEFPSQSGHEWAIGPWVSFMPSEFLRFRLGYKYTHRAGLDGPTSLNEILFQSTFILGAHPAHPF
jgi:opacity protein-like surface antigen